MLQSIKSQTKAFHAGYPEIPVVPTMAPRRTDGKHTHIAGIPTRGTTGLFVRHDDDFALGLSERIPVRSIFGAPAAA
jgi:hypothetical protein